MRFCNPPFSVALSVSTIDCSFLPFQKSLLLPSNVRGVSSPAAPKGPPLFGAFGGTFPRAD